MWRSAGQNNMPRRRSAEFLETTIMGNALAIEYRKICDIKAYTNTPRIHTRAQKRKLQSSMRRFGQLMPVLIDAGNTVIDGHEVVEQLKVLGWDEVAVVVVHNRDEAEIRAIRLAINRIPQDSKWDDSRLKIEFASLLELGYDLEVTGFDQVEVDLTFAIEDTASGLVEEPPPAVNPAAVAITRPNDLWLLGSHRVACGNSQDAELMGRLMNGQLAQMGFTDAPYNVAIAGFVSGLGQHSHREFAMASGEMSRDQFTEFLELVFKASCVALQDGAIFFNCMDWRHLSELCAAAERVGLTQLNLCVWTKTNAGMGSFYRSQHELVVPFKKGTAPHINNFELGKKGRSRSNVWTYRGMNSFGAGRDELLAQHPTVKPVGLVADAIKDVSYRNGIVLDPFLGSGTTLIAADSVGRRCYGIEIDPLYVDLIVRRWQDHSGGTAVDAVTGDTFDSRWAGASGLGNAEPVDPSRRDHAFSAEA
jgi:DNA modification methylase